MTILDKIIQNKQKEVQLLKDKFKIRDFEKMPFFSSEVTSLKNAITANEFGIIAEIKRKSPSAGTINNDLFPKELGLTYQNSGAAGISVLTDFDFFGGTIEDLIEVKKSVKIPVLRKEFIIDEIQIFQAKSIGADAILLIAEALTEQQALHFTIIAQSLGMEVVMEFHEKNQLYKINQDVDIIGVNNRNLKLQKTDISNSIELIDFLPKDRVLISESGIKTADDLKRIYQCGYHGALIGESILKSNSPLNFVSELQQSLLQTN
jgi:indole-3-glycerol phosphate synthase